MRAAAGWRRPRCLRGRRIEYLLEKGLKPAIVSGISSGAVNATLLCGAPDPDNRLQTLIKVWDELTIPLESITKVWDELGFRIGTLPSTWSNPAMYRPRTDYLELTSFYDTSPLRETLSKYVAWDKLTFDELKPVDPSQPRLILAATNIETGKIDAFDSRRMTIEPDHVLASGALPPGFTAAAARDVHGHTYTYWDGGLYNNTPLAQVIHALENENRQGQTKKVDMMIVVNLFPKKSRLPVNLFEVTDRSCEIIFANKTSSDSRRASETRKVIGLKDELEGLIKNLPDDTKTKFAALMKHPGYDVLKKWKPVFDDLIEIAYTEPEPMDAAINFAKETIERRRRAGYRDAMARYEEYLEAPKDA